MGAVKKDKMVALGTMAAGIAHEVLNPLAIINTHATNLERLVQKEDIDREKLVRATNAIHKAVKRTQDIVESIRRYSRDETDKEFSLVSVDELIEETLIFCRQRLNSVDIELIVEKNEGISVNGRPTELSQVLVNLLNNAYQAIKDLDERWIRIETKVDRMVQISVTDSGQGIREYVAKCLFESTITTKSSEEGTGLGLTLCRKIIEAHDGRIYLDRDCRNTRFCIELPLP